MNLFWRIRSLWSFSPFFAVTVDENYGTFPQRSIKDVHWRISLINLMLGTKTIYFLTYFKGHDNTNRNGWKLFYTLSLEDCLEKQDITEKAEEYTTFIRAISPTSKNEEFECQKDFLCYKIQSEQQRCDNAYNKMSYYLGVVLVIIPLLVPKFKLSLLPANSDMKNVGIALIVLLIYCLLNWILYSFAFVRVRGFSRSSFRELKLHNSSISAMEQLLTNYYFDWQNIQNEASYFVSFTLNTQNWVCSSVLFMICLLVLQSFAK